MDSKEYLISYGWKEGEALQKGGLKKPILVKHKKDKKGLGSAPGQDDSEAWWERLFDGHLKNLDVTSDTTNGGIKFKQNEVVASAVSKSSSPLYRWFVKGEGLRGTIGKSVAVKRQQVVSVASETSRRKRKRSENDGDQKALEKDSKAKKKSRKDKKDKKAKKDKKERKTKKDKKERKESTKKEKKKQKDKK